MNINKSKEAKKLPFYDWHKHPFAIPVMTFLVLFFVSCAVFIVLSGQTIGAKDSKVVRMYVDGKSRIVPTRAQSVRELIDQSGIELHKADLVEPSPDNPITGNNFSVNIYSARPVTVVDETGQTIVTRVAERQPINIAKKAGMNLYPEDKAVVVPPEETLKEGVLGEKIVIDRALPIKLSLHGNIYDIRTQAKTVADLARERKIQYDKNSVLPSPTTILKANDVVFISEPGRQITTTEEPIAQPVEYVESVDLDIGATQVREPGLPGKRAVIYEITQSGAKKPLQEIVLLQPQRKLVARGAKKTSGFNGSFEAALARLRSCEGSYSSNTGNGYYGAYQYDVRTWNGYGGFPNAAAAPPIVQDQKAWETYQRRGWQPWPSCSKKLGLQDTYR